MAGLDERLSPAGTSRANGNAPRETFGIYAGPAYHCSTTTSSPGIPSPPYQPRRTTMEPDTDGPLVPSAEAASYGIALVTA